MNFNGKVVAVTGAASGIGKAVATYLAERGATIAAIDLAESELPAGDGHLMLRADLTNPEEARGAVDSVVEKLGKIDVLVNSAGVALLDKARDISLDYWRKTLDINLSGSFYMAQAAGRHMLDAGYGRIINLASQAAEIGLDEHVAYCASKAGIVGMTKALSLEWAPHGVTVNAISPTIVATPLGKKAWAGEKGERAKEEIPTRRFAEPEEVAAMVAYVASDEAAMVTGTNLLIDGGRTSV